MWPVASTAWFTVYEKDAQSGTKHDLCTPPMENVLPHGLHWCLGCSSVHGKQEQKCPDGIPSAHCVPGTMSDVRDRAGAGAGAEAQLSNNATRTTIRTALAAWSGREGRFPSYSTVVQWGLKTSRKTPRCFSCLLASWNLPKGCLLAST